MIEEGNIYDFGNIYFLVVGIENNLHSIYQSPFLFNEVASMIKNRDITLFAYVVIRIKNLRNIKASILECDLDIMTYSCFEGCAIVKKIDLKRYKTDLIKLQLLKKLPSTLSRKDAETQLKDYINVQLEKFSSFRIGDIFVNRHGEERMYLGMATNFYVLILNLDTNVKNSISVLDTNEKNYISVESFLKFYRRNGKHKEIDTTAYILPEEVIRQLGVVK